MAFACQRIPIALFASDTSTNQQTNSTIRYDSIFGLIFNLKISSFPNSLNLALEDLAYVHSKLGSRQKIERAVWKDFWKWLEEGLRKIRFAKHLCDMWTAGAIAGFINRADTERLLADQPPGE